MFMLGLYKAYMLQVVNVPMLEDMKLTALFMTWQDRACCTNLGGRK